ncbi:MAG TPA: hypothetical protein PLI52_02895 [Prochlorococcaceae cyanobacterium AMR_MDS_5431]|nr:hypothetical protein [Prochlorococcaceae cyanobacterium AMR_MDS_5431]
MAKKGGMPAFMAKKMEDAKMKKGAAPKGKAKGPGKKGLGSKKK